ncbi:MAG: DegT/DnrJ/EryC1/StrS aminotransferase [Candidatus Gottesmanbacteria bacterium GW2011_GWA1_43_11]|uniref:DegT/DnrJ/EryC1/StrS aminotransferase n=1 Tax=Candidatus Gottesmanbacteria bacterium GW2011_GWA1_43_11 TaxID=1618436 RepID=A0A0G1EKZ5_9BACT|nr:MAG: DegT/DnrJ/EryC1/StrS aminotransferase [Candidatus Gottesmanbacteria bacterium GW2011_GWA1_43_11]
MPTKNYHIPLFYPFVSDEMRQAAYAALGEKIITQGQTVDEFESLLNQTLGTRNLLTVNSCTSALELAYHLLDLKPGDEVITPVFTCTATTVPLLRRGINIVFADVKENLLMDWKDAEKKITKKTRAIVDVHLFNQLNETQDLGIPIIGDAAQYLGKTYGEQFTAYSFQAVKLLTTVDGGALVCERKEDYKRAKLLRWYGIDRETSKENINVDITEAGFKYHMNNVTAAIGIAGLKILDKLKKKRALLQNHYQQRLKDIPNLTVIGGSPYLIHVPNRDKFMVKLASLGIETGLGHRRNDMYSLFGGKRQNLPTMNRLESMYLLLPCHNKMSVKDVEFICTAIKESQ